jgi:hypothetical protein
MDPSVQDIDMTRPVPVGPGVILPRDVTMWGRLKGILGRTQKCEYTTDDYINDVISRTGEWKEQLAGGEGALGVEIRKLIGGGFGFPEHPDIIQIKCDIGGGSEQVPFILNIPLDVAVELRKTISMTLEVIENQKAVGGWPLSTSPTTPGPWSGG